MRKMRLLAVALIAALVLALVGLVAAPASAVCIRDPINGGCMNFCPKKFNCLD